MSENELLGLDRRNDMQRLVVKGSQIHTETRIQFEMLIDDQPTESSHPVPPAGPCIVPRVPRKSGFGITHAGTENAQ